MRKSIHKFIKRTAIIVVALLSVAIVVIQLFIRNYRVIYGTVGYGNNVTYKGYYVEMRSIDDDSIQTYDGIIRKYANKIIEYPEFVLQIENINNQCMSSKAIKSRVVFNNQFIGIIPNKNAIIYFDAPGFTWTCIITNHNHMNKVIFNEKNAMSGGHLGTVTNSYVL